MRNQEGELELQKKLHRRKMTCRFQCNIYIFFYQTFRIFSQFLIISWYDFLIFYFFSFSIFIYFFIFDLISLFFIIISAMKFVHIVYIQSKYIQNQVVYYFGKSIYRQSRTFWTKKISGCYTKLYGWWYYEWTIENMKITINLILTASHL